MSYLEVFRFPLSVALKGKSSRSPVLTGAHKISHSGTARDNRHDVKTRWALSTTLKYSAERANFLCALIGGSYSYWDFEDQIPWSVDGVPIVDAGDFTSTANSKYGSYGATLEPGAEWDTQIEDSESWAAWAWFYTAGAYHHIYADSEGNKRYDGATTADPIYFEVNNGRLACTLDGDFDDMVLVRYPQPLDVSLFDDSLYDFHVARKWSRDLIVRGDFSGKGELVEFVATGLISPVSVGSAMIGGTWDNNRRSFQFELTELQDE